jgi:hypothetical protein
MKWYLAGPMSGIPQFNFPAFEEAAKVLRSRGMHIISPHEEDPPEMQAAAWASPDGKLTAEALAGHTWGETLARDVKLISDNVDGIVFLDRWWYSRGARLEAFVGLLTGKKFAKASYVTFRDFLKDVMVTRFSHIVDADDHYVRRTLEENMP